MVDELKVPLAPAGFEIDGYETVGEEIVAGPMAAVEIRGRRFNRQVHEAELFVNGHLIPDAYVAIEGPGVFLPRVVPEFPGPWNRVERPDLSTAADVERLHEALRVVVRPWCMAFAKRRTDHHDVTADGWRGVEADFTVDQIDGLAASEDGAGLQIHRAIAAERLHPCAGLRVEGHQK